MSHSAGIIAYSDDTPVLHVLLDLAVVVEVGDGGDVVHVVGDGWV